MVGRSFDTPRKFLPCSTPFPCAPLFDFYRCKEVLVHIKIKLRAVFVVLCHVHIYAYDGDGDGYS